MAGLRTWAVVMAGLAVLLVAPPARAQPVTPDTDPVTIDQVARTPGGPLTPEDQAFDQQVRQSYAAADSRQGPLEGLWRLSRSDGAPLFSFQLTDLPQGGVEGAWRDLRRTSALGGSGFIAEIYRDGETLRLSLYERDGDPATEIILSPSGTGAGAGAGEWTGSLWDDHAKLPVTMKRY